jgi:hypothetical protein
MIASARDAMSTTHEFVAIILYATTNGEERTHVAHRFHAASNTDATNAAKAWARSRLTRSEKMWLQVMRDGVPIANLGQEAI